MSHNVFLMLQECNKFREHQARELLIELLEHQLSERQGLIKELQAEIARADETLGLSNGSSDVKMKVEDDGDNVQS